MALLALHQMHNHRPSHQLPTALQVALDSSEHHGSGPVPMHPFPRTWFQLSTTLHPLQVVPLATTLRATTTLLMAMDPLTVDPLADPMAAPIVDTMVVPMVGPLEEALVVVVVVQAHPTTVHIPLSDPNLGPRNRIPMPTSP